MIVKGGYQDRQWIGDTRVVVSMWFNLGTLREDIGLFPLLIQ